MKLVVGLGNPGPEYERHRHNVGFMAVDEIHRRFGLSPWRRRFQGFSAEGPLAGDKLLALKPQTYMNLSGQAVGEAMRFYKLAPADVIVLHDDLDVQAGRIRVKLGGGHGGHNGLRSIDEHIGKDYWRIRIGIGHPGAKELVHGWVLSNFAKADEAWLPALLDAMARELPLIAGGEPEKYASRVALLTQPPKPPKQAKQPKEQPPKEGGPADA